MGLTARALASLEARADRWFPNASVVREVQGVSLSMPRAHRLPQIARDFPSYGQNLVRLVAEIAAAEPALVMLDVGANIGDSARQVLAATDARVWCVEGDPYWMPYLRRNVGDDPRVRITHALLTTGERAHERLGAVRRGGTTSFRVGGDEVGATLLDVSRLDAANPWGDPVRLLKTDTDGWDTRLVPALTNALAPQTPVAFLEYDPELSREAGDTHPERMWEAIADHGYDSAVVWDNFGVLMGTASVAAAAEGSRQMFRAPLAQRSFNYWDVAVVHRADERGRRALQRVASSAPTLLP